MPIHGFQERCGRLDRRIRINTDDPSGSYLISTHGAIHQVRLRRPRREAVIAP
jgi:hypothetical protein